MTTTATMTRRDTQTLTWDIDNRLVKIEGGGTTIMEYDSVGQRLIKNGPTGITIFPFDGIEIAGGIITKYIKIGGQIFAAKTATNQRFYHNDHLGGVNTITNADINNPRCQLDEYEPWGSVSREEGNCDPTHRFTGKELDLETGIYYYGGRYYDEEIGRFISPDPFVSSPDDPQNLNRYSYALNNPQTYIDPTGYEGEDAGVAFYFSWYSFFDSLFSSPHHPPRPVPRVFNRPMNQPRVMNWGGPLSESMLLYADNGYLQTLMGIVEGEKQDLNPPPLIWNEALSREAQSDESARRRPADAGRQEPKVIESQEYNGIDWAKLGSCALSSAGEHFGLTAAAGVSALLSLPPPKWAVPPYRQIGARSTNLLSVLGHYVPIRVPRIVIAGRGSTNLFRIIGRINPYVAVGLGVVDAVAIGYGTYQCYQGE